jgi:phage antirepressor YoqD-like protein
MNTKDTLTVMAEQDVFGKQFRVYGDLENMLFLAKDVAGWIEHSDVSTMLRTVDDSEKLTQTLFVSGQNRDAWFLTEDGLYEVLMQSRKPIAKQFKKKVKEILKTIRQTGGYVAEDREGEFIDIYFPRFSDETKLVMLHDLRKQNAELRETIVKQEPYVDFAVTVTESSDTIDIGQFAKLVNDENIDIGRNRLFRWLREEKFLQPNNDPYQKYINNGWFEISIKTYKASFGPKISIKTFVTGKGQVAILEKLRETFGGKKV